MKWYAKSLQNKAGQALIIDEETGRNVAVAYDQKDAEMLAAGPRLAAALKRAVEAAEDPGSDYDWIGEAVRELRGIGIKV